MLKILIVEDEAIVATGLEMLLEDAGFTVSGWAVDAAEALQLAEDQRPDLALVDLQLKGGDDGVQVAEQLTRRWGMEIIFLTAQSDPRTKARAQQTRHRGYMGKPYAPDELIRLIRSTAPGVAP
jgi:DNA-binding NarL/FixJ family response regulator